MNAVANKLPKEQMNELMVEMFGMIEDLNIKEGDYLKFADLFKQMNINVERLCQVKESIRTNIYYTRYIRPSTKTTLNKKKLTEAEKAVSPDFMLCNCGRYIQNANPNSVKCPVIEHLKTLVHYQGRRNRRISKKQLAESQICFEIDREVAVQSFTIKHIEKVKASPSIYFNVIGIKGDNAPEEIAASDTYAFYNITEAKEHFADACEMNERTGFYDFISLVIGEGHHLENGFDVVETKAFDNEEFEIGVTNGSATLKKENELIIEGKTPIFLAEEETPSIDYNIHLERVFDKAGLDLLATILKKDFKGYVRNLKASSIPLETRRKVIIDALMSQVVKTNKAEYILDKYFVNNEYWRYPKITKNLIAKVPVVPVITEKSNKKIVEKVVMLNGIRVVLMCEEGNDLLEQIQDRLVDEIESMKK